MYLYVSNIWTRINSLASRLPWCVCVFFVGLWGKIKHRCLPARIFALDLFRESWGCRRRHNIADKQYTTALATYFLIYINTYNAVHKIKYRNSTRNVMRAIFIQPKPLLMCQWENARCDDETEMETKTERKRACSCTLTYIEHAFEYWFHRI